MNIPHLFRNPRFWRWGIAFLPVLLIVAHTAYWYVAIHAIERDFATSVASYRAQGGVVEHGTPQRAGWPLRAMLNVPDVHLVGGQRLLPGGIDWRAQQVQLGVALTQPRTVRAELFGRQNLRVQDYEIPFTADRMVLRIFVEPGVPPRSGALRMSMLRAGIAGSALIVESGGINWDLRPAATESETALSGVIELANIRLPAGGALVLGERIDHLEVEAALIGPLPGGHGSFAHRATSWRDDGGTLRVQRLHMQWGAAQIAASATLALDDGLQPMGAANVHVAGVADVLGAMAANNVVPEQVAMVASHSLDFFRQTPSAEDGRPITEVPLTLQNRVLSMGRLALLQVPFFDWQGED